jgi:hypothetical protein
MSTNWDGLTDDRVTFADLLTLLHRRRFTGPVTLHFLKGKPELFEVGHPKRLRFSRMCLTQGLDHPDNGG